MEPTVISLTLILLALAGTRSGDAHVVAADYAEPEARIPFGGRWGPWDPWGSCSQSCGPGTKRRERECSDQPLDQLRIQCPGSSAQTAACNLQPCHSGNLGVVVNNVVYFPFRGNITVHLTPQYKRYQSCMTSAASRATAGGNRFSIASKCRQQALKPDLGGVGGAKWPGGEGTMELPSSRAACNLPTAISWLHKVRSGFDVTQVDLLPLELTGSMGFASPVFDYTCDMGLTFTINNQGPFPLPDDLVNIFPESMSTYSQSIENFKTSSEVKQSRSAKLEISGTYKLLSAGYSYTEETMTRTFLTESRHAFEMQYIASALRADYFPARSIDNSPQSLAAFYINQIGNMPYSARADKYHVYIRKFGTHLARWARLGGAVKYWEFTTNKYIEKNSAQTASQEASLGLKGFLSVKGGITTSVASQSSEFTDNSYKRFVAYGGNSDSFISGPDSLATWAATIIEKPHTIALSLESITSFIENPDLKAGMETAICVHIAKAYAQDLVKQTVIKLSKLPTSAQQFLQNVKTTLETSYLSILENNALASQHQALCNQLLTSYGATVEGELAKVNNLDPNASTQLETKSQSNKVNFVFTCPPGHTISKIQGTNYNGNKHSGYDKTWSFACRPTAFSLTRMVDCTESPWSPWSDSQASLVCPNNQVVAGVSSEHNGDNIGDRRWMLKCCGFVAQCSQISCSWTDWSPRERDVNYDKPHDWYLSGFQTKRECWKVKEAVFWSYTKCDRMYQYKYCRVQSC